MRRPSILRALVCSLLCLALGGVGRAQQLEPATVAGVTVRQATLANGLRVVVLRDPLAPVVSTYMNYLTGSDDESITGLAHAQEHMMFRGSRSLSAAGFAEVTALTGGSFDADTQNAVTQFYFTMPAADLDVALHLEASRATGILDSQALWNQERGAIEQEVQRDNSDASYRLYVDALHHLMAGTPYADAGLGTMRSFGTQVDAAQLRRFYRTWYHPNNAILVVAGDVDAAHVLREVRRLFGAIPAQAVPGPRPVALAPLTPAAYSDRSDAATTQVFLAFRFPGYDDPDYAASQILVDALNSQRGSLYDLVATGRALDTSAQAQPFEHAGLALIGSSVTPNVSPQQALVQLRAVIANDRRVGIPDDLVAAAKQAELAQAQFESTSIDGLAAEWSQALAVEHRTPADDLAAIRAVTTADVDRALRRWLDLRTATAATAVPQDVGTRAGGSNVATGLAQTTENNTIVPTHSVALPRWAEPLLKVQLPPLPAAPVVSTLPNGLRLIVQPEHVSHAVVVAGAIRSNPAVEEAPGREGVASLTDELLPYGTTTYDRLQYQAQLDAIAADVGTGRTFGLDVLSDHFDRGVRLLADDELHPAFPASAFALLKAQDARELASAQGSPGVIAERSLERALYPPGDPARRFATPVSLRRLTLADVRAWYAKAFRPDLTTIVVVGDVTPAQARASVARWFGAWRAAGPRPPLDLAPVRSNRPASFVVPATGRVQSSVTLAETVPLREDEPGVAPLRVASTVLSGGFYASLLFQDLRETRGLVYSVGTHLTTGRTRSTFTLAFGSAPQNVAAAEAIALADLRRLQQHPVDDRRLRVAKALLMGRLATSRASEDAIAAGLLRARLDGTPLDQPWIEGRGELAVTAAGLEAAMRRYVRPDGFVRVVEGPAAR